MAHGSAIETSSLLPWRTQQSGTFIPEPVEASRWDKLLGELGLTEPQALDAIQRNGDVGRLIRRFVDDSCHDHFVPEDVLQVLNLQRGDGKGDLVNVDQAH